MAAAQKKITVPTPDGRIEASVSPDGDYPGIAVLQFDKAGKERGAVIFEHCPGKGAQLRIYAPSDPDGDPVAIMDMSIGAKPE